MDLHGWDTAYATHIGQLNLALAAPGATVRSFEAEEEGWMVRGTLGPWRIVPGGAGILLHLEVPITEGSLCSSGGPEASLAGVSVLLEINLQVLPSKLPGEKELGFHFQHRGQPGGPATGATGAVTPLKVLNPAGLSFTQQAVLGAGLADSLVRQASAIAFSFASISVVPPGATGSWLSPRSCAYAYCQTDGGEGFLVIYGATDGRNTDALPRQVDPALIAGQAQACFAISPALFLKNVIQPLLPQVYAGTNAAAFTFDAAHTTIRATRAIGVGGVKSGAITYYPQIQSLAITTAGSRLNVRAEGDCDMYMGMSLAFAVSSQSESQFDASKATLSLRKDPHPEVSHSSHIPWYDYLMGPLADIIMLIVVPLVADGIANGLNSAMQGMTFSNAGPQSVRWAGMKTFTIQGGELNTAFRLWGRLS